MLGRRRWPSPSSGTASSIGRSIGCVKRNRREKGHEQPVQTAPLVCVGGWLDRSSPVPIRVEARVESRASSSRIAAATVAASRLDYSTNSSAPQPELGLGCAGDAASPSGGRNVPRPALWRQDAAPEQGLDG